MGAEAGTEWSFPLADQLWSSGFELVSSTPGVFSQSILAPPPASTHPASTPWRPDGLELGSDSVVNNRDIGPVDPFLGRIPIAKDVALDLSGRE